MYSRRRGRVGGTRRKRSSAAEVEGAKRSSTPTFLEYIEKRDFSGACAVLEVFIDSGDEKLATTHCGEGGLTVAQLWLGYCYFHLRDYEKALVVYTRLLESLEGETVSRDVSRSVSRPMIQLYSACCHFFLGSYRECHSLALSITELDPDSGSVSSLSHHSGSSSGGGPSFLPDPVSLMSLRSRLLVHVCDRVHDEQGVMMNHQRLTTSVQDRLSLAALHFARSHWQDSLEIYKQVVRAEHSYLAAQVYIAQVLYKTDFMEDALSVLKKYSLKFPDSTTVENLRSCCQFKLLGPEIAREELQPIIDAQAAGFSVENPLVAHNEVVFREGDGALRILPPLVDVVPEARLNLVVYYLRTDELQKAYELVKDLEPIKPEEYILKAVVLATLGQRDESAEMLKEAQQLFRMIGISESECDTIPGRQCMASYFYLHRQFEDVLTYLDSIQEFSETLDEYHWNRAVAQAHTGDFHSAEESLLRIRSPEITSEFSYLAWLVRCRIMTGKPHLAWELYIKMESNEYMRDIIILIANDCYRVGQFWYAAKAYNILERMDPNREFWEGKKGACLGSFQQIVAGQAPKERLRDIMIYLAQSKKPAVGRMLSTMKQWGEENGCRFDAHS